MSSQAAGPAGSRPTPAGNRGWERLMLYGLLVPPLAWVVELYLNFGLASHACFPGEAPRASFIPGWGRIWIALLAINIVCALVCAAGLITAGYGWRRLGKAAPVPREVWGVPYPSEGRLRQFALSGLIVRGLFTAAIVFNTISLWTLSTCSLV